MKRYKLFEESERAFVALQILEGVAKALNTDGKGREEMNWLDGLIEVGNKQDLYVDPETGLTIVVDPGGERYMPGLTIGNGLGLVRVGFMFDGRARLSIIHESTTDMDDALRISKAVRLGATRAKMWQAEYNS